MSESINWLQKGGHKFWLCWGRCFVKMGRPIVLEERQIRAGWLLGQYDRVLTSLIRRCQDWWGISHRIHPLQWRHNGHDGISNHQPLDCLLNRLFRCRSKKTSKLRVTGLCAGNSPVTSEFRAQMASNVENVSIWWHHHDRAKIWEIHLAPLCFP